VGKPLIHRGFVAKPPAYSHYEVVHFHKLLIPTFVGEELILLISALFDASDNKARPHLLMRSTVLTRATASLAGLVALGR
jgi:hypothetical protein